MDHKATSFACGCVAALNAIYAAKELDELVERDQENCAFVLYLDGRWRRYRFAGAWTAIDMATIKPPGKNRTVVAVSPGGAFWEVNPSTGEEINGHTRADNSLRSLAAIDDVIYACGMGRSVLRRESPGVWNEIGPGVSGQDQGLVVGLEGLDGFPSKEMYAVGWRGEIWQGHSNKWRRVDSPVSANLNSVCCAADGQVYIVGDDGTMLRGRDDVWKVLDTNRTDNLMDVAFHGGTVFVSTDFEILKLDNTSLSPEDSFADEDDRPSTCLHLLAAKDGLVSMGPKDMFILRDSVWQRLV
jgi:hypothetical protein